MTPLYYTHFLCHINVGIGRQLHVAAGREEEAVRRQKLQKKVNLILPSRASWQTRDHTMADGGGADAGPIQGSDRYNGGGGDDDRGRCMLLTEDSGLCVYVAIFACFEKLIVFVVDRDRDRDRV